MNKKDTIHKKKISEMALKDIINGTVFRYTSTGIIELTIILLTSTWTKWSLLKVIIIIFLGLGNIVLFVYYANQTFNERRTVEYLEVQTETFHDAVQSIGRTCQVVANSASEMIDDILNQKSDRHIWTFRETANGCMHAIYEILKNYTHSEDFEIVYTQVVKRGIIKTIAFEGKYSDRYPSIYDVERNIVSNNYYDSRHIRENNHSIKVLLTKDEIGKAFYKEGNHDISQYNQYISIPVICNNKKIIGILSVVCLKETNLGKDTEEVLYNINNYVCPYRDVLLLTYKMERALAMGQIQMEERMNEKE